MSAFTEIYVIPDTDGAVVDARHPVPADRGMESGIVSPQLPAVSRAARVSVSLVRTGMIRSVDLDLYLIAAFVRYAGDVKTGIGERPFDTSEGDAVQAHVRLPVDAVEI